MATIQVTLETNMVVLGMTVAMVTITTNQLQAVVVKVMATIAAIMVTMATHRNTCLLIVSFLFLILF